MRRQHGAERSHGRGAGSVDVTSSQSLDDLVDDYMSWRKACGGVSAAYAHWQRAARQECKLAFSEYVAALNCEEEAAMVYQQAVERLGTTAPEMLTLRHL
jgi:hypothetical protein